MANLRALVKRRKAIRNIRKITRTMELIATARFKKALDRATEADAYTRKIAELAADLSSSAGEVSHPLLAVRPTVKKALVLVITSNRGLCGGYNGGILREAQATAAAGPKAEYEFLPAAAGILEEVLPVSFKVRLFKCFLDAAVSEQIARRVAMKAATDNAGDLIKEITRIYNRTRQANITKEISELIAGSEALK